MKKSKSKVEQQILKDKAFRRVLAKRSFYWFFHIYFAHYIKYETAKFQREIFSILEDNNVSNVAIVAFRGSAKSTITSLAYAIWSIVGDQKRNYKSKGLKSCINTKKPIRPREIDVDHQAVFCILSF